MTTLALMGKVKQMSVREKRSVREIVQLTSWSCNTLRKWLKAPGKLMPFHDAIKRAVKADAHRPPHRPHTACALHAQSKCESDARSCRHVTAFVRDWRCAEGPSVSAMACCRMQVLTPQLRASRCLMVMGHMSQKQSRGGSISVRTEAAYKSDDRPGMDSVR